MGVKGWPFCRVWVGPTVDKLCHGSRALTSCDLILNSLKGRGIFTRNARSTRRGPETCRAKKKKESDYMGSRGSKTITGRRSKKLNSLEKLRQLFASACRDRRTAVHGPPGGVGFPFHFAQSIVTRAAHRSPETSGLRGYNLRHSGYNPRGV
jgi:hypothetical protein